MVQMRTQEHLVFLLYMHVFYGLCHQLKFPIYVSYSFIKLKAQYY